MGPGEFLTNSCRNRVAVAGGRHYALTDLDRRSLDAIWAFLLPVGGWGVLLHGGATGADAGAAAWAKQRGVPTVSLHVDDALWRSVGPAAGPIRNRMMMRSADMLVAFPGGAGTASAVKEATRRRLLIVQLPLPTPECSLAGIVAMLEVHP